MRLWTEHSTSATTENGVKIRLACDVHRLFVPALDLLPPHHRVGIDRDTEFIPRIPTLSGSVTVIGRNLREMKNPHRIFPGLYHVTALFQTQQHIHAT